MTNLPEPNFIERDADKVTQAWIDLYEQKSGKTLQPAQLERLMIDVGAYRENILRISIQETAKQNLLSYAPLDVLRHIGEPLGVKQLKASHAKTVLKFEVETPLDFNFVISKGAQVETKDGLYIFETLQDGILEEGSLSVEIESQCQIAGIGANNYTLGAINNLITPLSYITSVSNTTISSGGADDEEADSLRDRIRQAPEKFSNAGSRGAYRYHTLSANSTITDVSIISPSPGVVNIYPLTTTGNPDIELIKIVQEYLNDEKIRPLTDFVQVLSPIKKQFYINAVLTLFKDADATSVLATANAKMKEFKNTLAARLGKDVVRTQIIAILNSIYSVFKVDLNTPQNDISVLENEWSDLTDYSIVIGGYADE